MKSLIKQRLWTFRVFHEVEEEHVVKVATNLLLVMKVKAIVKFRKFKYYFYSFGLVSTREASMLFAVENSFTTFIDEMRTDRILFYI